MIVFVDFDGVLHPETIKREGELLCCRASLWAVLEAVPTDISAYN